MFKEKEAGSSGVPERDGARNASDTVGEEVPRSKETDHKYYFNKTMDTVRCFLDLTSIRRQP